LGSKIERRRSDRVVVGGDVAVAAVVARTVSLDLWFSLTKAV
jgi:hypothetical protein